jgi:hypothetical protein
MHTDARRRPRPNAAHLQAVPLRVWPSRNTRPPAPHIQDTQRALPAVGVQGMNSCRKRGSSSSKSPSVRTCDGEGGEKRERSAAPQYHGGTRHRANANSRARSTGPPLLLPMPLGRVQAQGWGKYRVRQRCHWPRRAHCPHLRRNDGSRRGGPKALLPAAGLRCVAAHVASHGLGQWLPRCGGVERNAEGLRHQDCVLFACWGRGREACVHAQPTATCA